jgi:hypothetical protein
VVSRDFGLGKFGRSLDRRDFKGRRVDLIGRSIDARPGESVLSALRRYLRDAKTTSARCLAAKAVVLLDPARLRGTVAWPEAALARGTSKGANARNGFKTSGTVLPLPLRERAGVRGKRESRSA